MGILNDFIGLQTSLARRGIFSTFKSKSLDLMGSTRIQQPHRTTQYGESVTGTAGGLPSLLAHHPVGTKTADRRRHLFRRKKDISTSSSCESMSHSRNSSVDSQSSSVQRGLGSVLKTSTLFSWNSIDTSSKQLSFIERKSTQFINFIRRLLFVIFESDNLKYWYLYTERYADIVVLYTYLDWLHKNV